MARYIDVDVLWKSVTGNIDDCADFLEIIERQPTVTINDIADEIKVTDCNHIADADKKVSFSWGHENGKSVIYRQDAIDAVENCEPGEELFVIKSLPSAQPERTCVNCGRTANNGGWYADGGTRCPIEEHYALPKDGYCHLWDKRNVTDDDYPERQEE